MLAGIFFYRSSNTTLGVFVTDSICLEVLIWLCWYFSIHRGVVYLGWTDVVLEWEWLMMYVSYKIRRDWLMADNMSKSLQRLHHSFSLIHHAHFTEA